MALKVAVLGASGNIGSAIVRELASRSKYQIVGISRHPDNIPKADGVTAVEGDASKPESVQSHLDGADYIFSALHFDPPASAIVKLAKTAGAKRLLVVGGAASLHVSEGGPILYDTPEFPAEYKEIAKAGIEYFKEIQQEKDLDWTFFSPPLVIGPGDRKGTYRLGKDVLVTDDKGDSTISYDDYALAFVDELVNHKFSKTRFTAAY